MIRFSIPYSSDLELTREIIRRYKERIEEVCFPIDSDIATTSKTATVKKVSGDEARELVRILARNGIKSNILINAVHQGNRDPERMKDHIRSIGGVDSITIADLYLLEVFKGFGPRMHVSLGAQFDSVEKTRRILARYPDLAICIATDLNRDLGALKKIYALKECFPDFTVKLMVNEGCLFHCTGRSRHALLLCLSPAERKYEGKRFQCPSHVSLDEVGKEMIKSPFIRPEDLSFYEENRTVDFFKIVGRPGAGKPLLTIVDGYMKGSHKGSIMQLMGTSSMGDYLNRYLFDIDNQKFPGDFVEKVTGCDKFCAGCDYCADIARKVTVPRDIKKRNENWIKR